MKKRALTPAVDKGVCAVEEAGTIPGEWTCKLGQRTNTVHVYERWDRRGVVYVRFTPPSADGRDKRTKRPLHIALGEPTAYTVRKLPLRVASDSAPLDVRSLALDAGKVRVAEQAAKRLHNLLAAGTDPAQESANQKNDKPLTLSQGFKLAFADIGGKYPSPTRHSKECERASKVIEDVLGRNTAWEDVTESRVTKLVQTLADRFIRDESGGPRWMEVVVSSLYAVAAFLRTEKKVSKECLLPPKKWRETVYQNWEERTDSTVEVTRLRHSASELVALWKAVYDLSSKIDPRIRLAMLLAGELRAGQGLRVSRKSLDLSSSPVAPFGTFIVRGRRGKPGETVVLSEGDRGIIDLMLTEGHLSLYEDMYRRGKLANYPMFPGGKLREGKCNPRKSHSVMDRRTALEQFHVLETVAGISSKEGRGWYGVRRASVDLAEILSDDDKVKNTLGGWTQHSDTRKRIYLHDEVDRRRSGARDLRVLVRGQTYESGVGS
ncbi:MAG: hypothetical protein V4550_11655 [Gemmatimonadota bacterium]